MSLAAQMTALPSKRGAGNRNPELGTQSTHLLTLVSGQCTPGGNFACWKDIFLIFKYFTSSKAPILNDKGKEIEVNISRCQPHVMDDVVDWWPHISPLIMITGLSRSQWGHLI